MSLVRVHWRIGEATGHGEAIERALAARVLAIARQMGGRASFWLEEAS